MANTLLIEKQNGGYFKFTLNGDTSNAITSIQNDLLAVGNELHFKTGNGANIIKEQSIYPADVTIVAAGTFTFTTVAAVWNKLIDVGYFDWLGGGVGGVDRFDELLDTFQYTGNAGKAVIVDNSELKLVPITLYNKRLFTELEDTPSSLVPDKMVVVNPAGTALILKDQPEPPEEYLNSVGYFDYNDLATQTTPLNATANVALKLTNDTEGANTSTDQNPYGVSYVWDYTTNQFNFNELEVGDTIDVRVHVQVTTTSANQRVILSAKFGIGSVVEFTNIIYENQFKTAGLHEINFVAPFYMGSTYITDNPAELYLTTDASATVKVDGWYVRILRKNINIITVDYQVPDATTLAKGIVRLAGDLGGTANVPTVPELANKVPNTRTVSTTSPLLGGGALSSNLTLSIQQANSVNSGFLTYADWTRFDEAHNDRIVSAAVTGTTTKTLTLNQHDGGFIQANWTDNDTAITLGTPANGLGLADQVLSLGLSSATTIGALSSTDWSTFNNKQGALNGTGFVKIIGTTISYDDSSYALDSVVVKLTGGQTIAGNKTFSSVSKFDDGINIKQTTGISLFTGYSGIAANTNGFFLSNSNTKYAYLNFATMSTNRDFTFPDSSGTFALTSNLHNAVTVGGGFNGLSIDSNQVLSLALASASTNGALSSTDWTTFNSKQGALNGTGFVKVVGTTVSYDNSTYALDSVVVKLTGDQTIAGNKTFSNIVQASAFKLTGMTAGSGALYWTSDRVTLANYNTNGVVEIEALGGSSIATFGNSIDFTKTVFVSSNLYANGLISRGTPANTLSYLSGSGAIFIRSLADETAYAFQLNTSSGLDLWSTNSGGTSTRRLTLDSSGNLGIGTTSPTTKLQVSGGNFTISDTTSPRSIVSGNTSNGFPGYMLSNTTQEYEIIVRGNLSNSFQIRNSTASTDLMTITSGGNFGIGTTSPNYSSGGRTVVDINGTSQSMLALSVGGVGKSFLFYTGTDLLVSNESNGAIKFNTNGSEKAIITSGGNVGIGTTSPTLGKLQVVKSESGSAPGAVLRLENTGANYTSKLVLTDGTTNDANISYLGATQSLGFGLGTSLNQMVLTLSGNVLIGTTTSYSGKFNVAGGMYSIDNVIGSYSTSSATSYGFFNTGSGTFILTNAGVANVGSFSMATGVYTPLSDINKKKDFEESTIGLKEILKLKPTLYRMKSDDTEGKKELGFIAQEVKDIIPNAYVESGEFIGLNFNAIVAALVKSVQELKAEIEILKNK